MVNEQLFILQSKSKNVKRLWNNFFLLDYFHLNRVPWSRHFAVLSLWVWINVYVSDIPKGKAWLGETVLSFASSHVWSPLRLFRTPGLRLRVAPYIWWKLSDTPGVTSGFTKPISRSLLMGNPTSGKFSFAMIRRAGIEWSKCNDSMNAWLPQ